MIVRSAVLIQRAGGLGRVAHSIIPTYRGVFQLCVIEVAIVALAPGVLIRFIVHEPHFRCIFELGWAYFQGVDGIDLAIVGGTALDAGSAIRPCQVFSRVVSVRRHRVWEIEPLDGSCLRLERANQIITSVSGEVVCRKRADSLAFDPAIAILALLILVLWQATIVQVQVEDFLILGYSQWLVRTHRTLAPTPLLHHVLRLWLHEFSVTCHELRAMQALQAINMLRDVYSCGIHASVATRAYTIFVLHLLGVRGHTVAIFILLSRIALRVEEEV